ncbi:MerR family transcriptional regulator [Actinokineospora pegani]|uniref:MerR family transcriptional regulator n=1 Tax=Actinokineospora pegani TaxID=2654637 RepID=UPI001F2B3015|nr:MerR family transcriptional regulator [Actinokineospora pegani]
MPSETTADGPGESRPVAPPPTGPGLEPTLPVAAVARRLGIAPATLRTWDRRYGLGPTGHTTGRHRRYATADLARLELMRRALLKGAAPAEAADYALRVSADPTALADLELPDPHAIPAQARAGGPPRPVPPDAAPQVRALARAVLAMDDPAVSAALSGALAEHGVVWVWDELVVPVLAAVGVGWTSPAAAGSEVAHLLAECVLTEVMRATPPVRGEPRVLLCGAPGEPYALPLYVARAALAQRGVPVRMLGAALPVAALANAARRTGPAVVAVWAQATAHAEPKALRAVPTTRPRVRVLACGPGWATAGLSPTVEHLPGVGDTVERVDALSPRAAHSPGE